MSDTSTVERGKAEKKEITFLFVHAASVHLLFYWLLILPAVRS
jgi:hypothetical protein